MEAYEERTDSHREEMMAIMKACLGKMEVRMEISQAKLKATDLEANPE
jgi:hypothetical protein